MILLLDTNCWIQVARNREYAADIRRLLTEVPATQVVLTDFSLYSIALAMRRHKMLDAFPAFLDQVGIGRTIAPIRLAPLELARVVEACSAHNLDFDDAYQYVTAEIHGLQLVSLDADFDRTPNGRLTPAAALQRFKDEQQQQET